MVATVQGTEIDTRTAGSPAQLLEEMTRMLECPTAIDRNVPFSGFPPAR